MATFEALASVRDRLFWLVREDQTRQVSMTRPDRALVASFLAIGDLSSMVSDPLDWLGYRGKLDRARIDG